jgi:non-ribosomal peptide synthase protein (TIGR01720 family)
LFSQIDGKQALSLPLKSDSLKDWADELQRFSRSPVLLGELAYWKTVSASITPIVDREFDFPDNIMRDEEKLLFEIPKKITRLLLSEVHRAYKTEVNDILIAALFLGLTRFSGKENVSLVLEGHGREDIIQNRDISRTVGWFAGEFPVSIKLPRETEEGKVIKEIKEMLRRVPRKGIGYGILKYIAEVNVPELDRQPQIRFNYLGQFVDSSSNTRVEVVNEAVPALANPLMVREYDFDLNGLVINDQMMFEMRYNTKQFSKHTIEKMVNSIRESLFMLVDHCVKRSDYEVTPSDFSEVDISFSELDQLNQLFNNKT